MSKTILDDFMEKYPKAKREEIPDCYCTEDLGFPHISDCIRHISHFSKPIKCEECWHRPLSEVKSV